MYALLVAATLAVWPEGGNGAGQYWCQQEVKKLALRVESLRGELSPRRYESLQDWLYIADSQCHSRVHDAQQTMRQIREMVAADLNRPQQSQSR